jgi:hypothetical protein
MGPSLMRRPPKYVQSFIDRHSKPRYYLRRPGFKRVPYWRWKTARRASA